ncbi:semaphorin-7A-like [Narcine bancroftii]|uniref:semaphorin-7A-like n=1 Tax=Narcine bancroftii TaxID=1343680 RepID=UPI003831DE80
MVEIFNVGDRISLTLSLPPTRLGSRDPTLDNAVQPHRTTGLRSRRRNNHRRRADTSLGAERGRERVGRGRSGSDRRSEREGGQTEKSACNEESGGGLGAEMLQAHFLALAQLLVLGTAERVPRLKFTPADLPRVAFGAPSRSSVGYHDERSDALYLGATGSVYLLRFTDFNVSQIQVLVPGVAGSLSPWMTMPGSLARAKGHQVRAKVLNEVISQTACSLSDVEETTMEAPDDPCRFRISPKMSKEMTLWESDHGGGPVRGSAAEEHTGGGLLKAPSLAPNSVICDLKQLQVDPIDEGVDLWGEIESSGTVLLEYSVVNHCGFYAIAIIWLICENMAKRVGCCFKVASLAANAPLLQGLCENVITVIQRVNRTSIIICGTHGGSPKCWFLPDNGTQLARDNQGHKLVKDGKDISPSAPTQRPITITVDEDLYSAISSTKQKSGSIQRSHGRAKHLKTEDRWFQNPTFVGSAWIQLKDSNKDEIYFFFRETNDSTALDGEPYKAYIGRVCKGDEGGSKAAAQNSFSTFLKARLICGFPAESRLFNKIEDAFVLFDKDDLRNTVVYGVFSSLWNSTAVCAYSQTDIEWTFRNSRLKGFTGNLAGGHWPGMDIWSSDGRAAMTRIRGQGIGSWDGQAPGVRICGWGVGSWDGQVAGAWVLSWAIGTTEGHECVKGNVPRNVLTTIRNFPEIEDPIYPIKRHPIYVMKHNNYTRLAADRVKGANQDFYNVLFLGTGNGKIHKVLHHQGKAFIISELNPFTDEAPVTTMMLDSRTGHLFVGTPVETVRLPLASCGEYGRTCAQCVATRDPYCGWDRDSGKCVAVPQSPNITNSEVLQSLEQLNVSICGSASDVVPLDEEPTELIVSSGAYLYLPCPVKSYHAIYTWSYNLEDHFACTIKDGSCPLMFNGEFPMSEGLFKCTAIEDGLKEELAAYKVMLSEGSALGLECTVLILGIAALCSLL